MNNSKTKVIVAGATGFIGRNITQKLVNNSKYSVTGIWNKRPPFKLQNLNYKKRPHLKIDTILLEK